MYGTSIRPGVLGKGGGGLFRYVSYLTPSPLLRTPMAVANTAVTKN